MKLKPCLFSYRGPLIFEELGTIPVYSMAVDVPILLLQPLSTILLGMKYMYSEAVLNCFFTGMSIFILHLT